MKELELKYYKSIASQYPTIAAASTEIINLASILNLPKGTEHFLTDLHGEYEQFIHVLRNGSGAVRRKIDDEFGNTLSSKDKKRLATLIYYPEQKLESIIRDEENVEDWYKITLHRLVQITKRVASKYTRSKVRKALPGDFAYVIEELITEKAEVQDKEAYYNSIINTIITIGRAKEFIVEISYLIQRLVVDHLHILGDVFDRGPGAHIIMDTLVNYHSVDIQWGNHDVVWMGAASGHLPCIANVIRLSAKHGNLNTLEEGYGINLIPLATFAMEVYKEDPCACFSIDHDEKYDEKDISLDMKMHKAIAIIQFKLEGQLIKQRPEFHMNQRLILDKINREKGTVTVEGKEYQLEDSCFPTIDEESPYTLTCEEERLMDRLQMAFTKCEKLQAHIRFLLAKGSMYKVYNSNLLYHGCVPFQKDGSFRKVKIFEQEYSGKDLYDILESYVRKGYYAPDQQEEKLRGQDIMWYIWSNEDSPVYGKAKMATFERYFIKDSKVKNEEKDYYYSLIEREDIIMKILEEFDLDKNNSHIINGHIPVALKNGETPIKCNGKLLMIDGGLSKAYQSKTGIAGYTLIYNSYGLRLVSHEPFESMEVAIEKETDIYSETVLVEQVIKRCKVADTDTGKIIKEKIEDLEKLLHYYRNGITFGIESKSIKMV